jgi:glucosyl-3-phosphoglycerate synthase
MPAHRDEGGQAVDADVARWFDRRTSTAEQWPLDLLRAVKGATTVSVVLPALNEEPTVGRIVESIHRSLGAGAPASDRLVDELVVVDSASVDRTAEVARAAGATIVHRDEVLPHLPAVSGKGESMWRGLAATTDDTVALVKAVYERPLVEGSSVVSAGGGRVTELLARPLLNVLWPSLAGVIQPLAGEYAARRTLLEQVAFPCGYGVELALLVDTLELHGLDAVAQVDLGVRVHRHHDEQRLGRMAAEILRTALDRYARGHDSLRLDLGTTLTQFERGAEGFVAHEHGVAMLERPPLAGVPEYAAQA